MQRADRGDFENSRIARGMRLEGFTILDVLGEGGMGRVFSAVDDGGHAIAIKTLLPSDPIHAEYFRQEIATLSALQHPGIVPFRGHGVFHGQPWYAMDLLQGATLRDALVQRSQKGDDKARKAWVPTTRITGNEGAAPVVKVAHIAPALGALSSPDLLRICASVLETLEHVHARGIVHGDLKPENIFLVEGRRPVLVDFGVSASFDRPREQLTVIPRSLGSVAYMAPERLRGALPDARADLYALGCILYECLTGTHPFMRPTVEGTTLAHLRAEVPPPSRVIPDLSARVESLVLRLLAKSPSDRPGYARDALHVISSCLPDSPESKPPASHPPGYLYRAPLVGRAEPLAALRNRFARALEGECSHVLIRGDPGVGKTRLALEVVQSALKEDAVVFHLECSASEDAHPGGSLTPLLRTLQDHAASGETTAADQWFAMAETALVTLDEARPSSPTSEYVATARRDFARGLSNAVIAIARLRPVLLVMDDLHHAGSPTIEFVRQLMALDVRDTRLLFLCSALAGTALEAFPRLDRFEEIHLRPFGEMEVEAALRAMLAMEHPSPSLVRRAYEVSEGNPFILAHFLRALIGASVLQHDRHRGWHLGAAAELSGDRALPGLESIRKVFEYRVRQLSDAQLGLARVAALLQASFDTTTLATVVREDVDHVAPIVATLCRDQIFVKQAHGGYKFSHSILQDILRDGLSESEVKRSHRRIAAALRVLRASASVSPAVLALHLSRCGSHRKAADAFREAGDSYLLTHRRVEALQCFEAAIAALRRLPQVAARRAQELLVLEEKLGDACSSERQFQKAAAAYEEAVAALPDDPVTAARLHRKLASAHQRDRVLAMTHLKQAAHILDGAARGLNGFTDEWIQVHLETMWIHYWNQETSALLDVAGRIAPTILQSGTVRQRASLDFNLAVGLMQQNRYVTGPVELAHVERALQIYEELEDRPNIAMCRFVRSMILLFQDDLAAAERGFEDILSVSEKATSVTIRVRALTFLCIVYRKRRDRERVRKLATAALSLATEHEMLEYQGTAMANLAWVALGDGEVEECDRLVKGARDAWDASPLNVFRWTGLLPEMGLLVLSPESDRDVNRLADIAGGLLHESQQRLPEGLSRVLEKLRSSDSVAEARQLASRALEEARAVGLA